MTPQTRPNRPRYAARLNAFKTKESLGWRSGQMGRP